VKSIAWNSSKNEWLKAARGISFEDVVIHIESGDIIETYDHPDQQRYPGQRIHAIAVRNHVVLVPFVETDEYVFLKTIIPSRKATRRYRGKRT